MSQIVRDQNKTYHVQELMQRADNVNTPDFLERKLEKYIPVFVYGTLKAGGRFHDVLNKAPCFGDARSVTSGYIMKAAYNDSFPVVLASTRGETYPIYGEIYIVNANILLELDRIEGNNEMYKREQKWFWLEDQSIKGKGGMLRPSIKAWVYLGMPDFWTGVPVTKVSPKGKEDKRFYEWSVEPPRSALKYAPKSRVAPEHSVETSRMWDMHYEGDDLFEQEIAWAEYDEALRKKNEKFAEGDILPPFDI